MPTPSPAYVVASYARATTMNAALPAGATASSNELAKLRKRVALLERMRADEAALRALQFEENDTEDKGGILRMMRDESTAVPTETLPLPPPPVNPEKGKESSPVVAEEPTDVEVAPPPATDETTMLKIFGIECDSVKMCTGVMNDVVGKMASTKTSNDMFLHEVSLRSIVLNQLFDNCDAVVDDVWAQCVERYHLPATKEGDRWLFDYGLSHAWTPDGPVVERTVMDAADALNALKTPSPDGSQDTDPRRTHPGVAKRKPQPLELRCIAMGRDGPCTKRVSKERASIGKITCGYHDNQEPDDEDNTDGEYEVIATPDAGMAMSRPSGTATAIGHASSAEDKKQKATDAVAPTQSKRVRWTDEEHQLFLEGVKQFGKGAAANRQISEKFVTTKTPSQVASHAQKYYLKVNASSAPPEDSAMNKTKRGTATANFSKSRIDLNNIVWVKTGKTVHWPGSIIQMHDGNGQCKTNYGLFPSEFVDGKPRYVALLYDNTVTEPKTARNVTYFCPGQSFRKFSKIGKTPGFVRAVKDACHDYNESRREHDKSKNITTAPEHLCIF